jgi:hypothetical protein
MSIFVNGGTGFIYLHFALEWRYRSNNSSISTLLPIQDEPSLSAKDQHATLLAQAGQVA